MANHYYCSDRTRVTEAQIKYRLRKSYEKHDAYFINDGLCEGCYGQAQCHAHIIPKARCKQMKKTQLIWDEANYFPACHKCNRIAENVSSEAITKLKNFELIKAFLELHDPERASKLPTL